MLKLVGTSVEGLRDCCRCVPTKISCSWFCDINLENFIVADVSRK